MSDEITMNGEIKIEEETKEEEKVETEFPSKVKLFTEDNKIVGGYIYNSR